MSKPYQKEENTWLEDIQAKMKKDGLLDNKDDDKKNFILVTESKLEDFFKAFEALKRLTENL